MKLGRNDFVHTAQTMARAVVMATHLGKLGTPPVASGPWGMAVEKNPKFTEWGLMGNDSVGDCTCADVAHSLMLYTGLGKGPFTMPTAQDTLKLYSAITGYNPSDPNTDQGADMVTVAKYIKDTGFLGHKIDDFGVLDPSNLDSVLWSVHLFGTCKIGIQVPSFAMDQFDNNQPWDYTGQPYTIEGGHDIPIFQYQAAVGGPLFYVLTWGKLQPMTFAFYKQFCMEAIAPVSADFCYATGMAPSGFDLPTLLSDLHNIG